MKKLVCLALALLMCATMLTSCGKFDMENADLSAYVKLCDISEFAYADLCQAYEDYRETLSQDLSSCNLTTGYTIDFFVTAEIMENGAAVETIADWTHNTDADMVKGYEVYRKATAFDLALVYKVTETGENSTDVRTVKIGEDFAFGLVFPEDYENESVAGKTVRFTVNVKKALPAVYNDTYLADRLAKFYTSVATAKETIEMGDTAIIDFKGTIEGSAFDGGTVENYQWIVGEGIEVNGVIVPDFEEQLLGHKRKEKFDITVNLPEDYADETLAGKEVVFSIKVEDIYNDNSLITDNTPFADLWELKYALRVESYIEYAIIDYVKERSELIEYPEQLIKDFEKIFKSYVKRDVAEGVLEYAKRGETYSKKEVKELLYPNGSDITYIEDGAKKAAYDYMIAVAVQRELGHEYTEKNYEKDLKLFAEELTAYYGETYTTEDVEELYGEEVLRVSFITALVTDSLVERVADMPEIPGK